VRNERVCMGFPDLYKNAYAKGTVFQFMQTSNEGVIGAGIKGQRGMILRRQEK
jgi:hypothetical protein